MTGCATLSGQMQPVTTQVELPREIERVYLPPFDYPDAFSCVSRSGMIPVGGAYIPTQNTTCFMNSDARTLRQSLISSLQADPRVAVIEQMPANGDGDAASATLEVTFKQLGLANTWDGAACEMAGTAIVKRNGTSRREDFSIRERSLFATVTGAKTEAYAAFSKQMTGLISGDSAADNDSTTTD
ncbi:hypothetical protein T5B8_07113 [Salinisphaera sp. T5B8]